MENGSMQQQMDVAAGKAAEIAAGMPDISAPFWAWLVFGGLVAIMLAVDLLVFEKKPHARTLREAAVWSAVWIALALLFNVGVYFWEGRERAIEFLTAYLVEKSLSVDNLFVFLVIFRFFGVEDRYQPRVLFWGIIGAIAMRAILIFAGVSLLYYFDWLLYFFGAILLYTGFKLMFSRDESYRPSETLAYKLVRRYARITEHFHGEHFFAREGGRLVATPMLLVLVIVEATDLVFAADSIPACLGISRDGFVVFTSNIFAILGLRALYFLLSGLMGRLRFLKPALSIVLVFIGVKMIVEEASKSDTLGSLTSRLPHISTSMSLAVIGGILTLAAALSFLVPSKGTASEEAGPQDKAGTSAEDSPSKTAGSSDGAAGDSDTPAAPRDTGGGEKT